VFQLTYADLVVVAFFEDVYNLLGATINLDPHPKLAALKRRVESIPELAHYLDTRPSIDKPLINFFNIYIRQFMNM
jgi:glutathione S-transferase